MRHRSFLCALALLTACSTSNSFVYEYRLKDDPCELVVDAHNHLMTANDVPSVGTVRHSGGGGRQAVARLVQWVLDIAKPEDNPSDLEPEAREFFSSELRELPGVADGWANFGTIGMALGATKTRTSKFVLLLNTYPEVDVFTPILVDLDGWAGRDDNQIAVHLRIEALSVLMRAVNVKYPGLMHAVAGYNPLHGVEETPVFVPGYRELLREAILDQGFIGFKVYPSNGFRPTGNSELPDAQLPTPAGIRDFDVTQSGVGDGERYYFELGDRDKVRFRRYLAKRVDEELEWLYGFAEENSIPIITHSSEVGAKLGKNYPNVYGRPEYWRPVLVAHPNLILDIGHFGKGERLLREEVRSDECFDERGHVTSCNWAEVIVSLINEFPMVYTDLSHDGVPNRKFSEYIGALDRITKRFPYLQTRIMWGSDWYMLTQDPFADDYYDRYHRELLDLEPELERRIMGANAAQFYGFTDGVQRSRLQDYYRDRGLEFPQWLIFEESSCTEN